MARARVRVRVSVDEGSSCGTRHTLTLTHTHAHTDTHRDRVSDLKATQGLSKGRPRPSNVMASDVHRVAAGGWILQVIGSGWRWLALALAEARRSTPAATKHCANHHTAGKGVRTVLYRML